MTNHKDYERQIMTFTSGSPSEYHEAKKLLADDKEYLHALGPAVAIARGSIIGESPESKEQVAELLQRSVQKVCELRDFDRGVVESVLLEISKDAQRRVDHSMATIHVTLEKNNETRQATPKSIGMGL